MAIPLRRLGKTGLDVSILGFGCMRLPLRGDKPEDIDEPLAIAMIRKAIDAGVNYVDTAYPYHCNNFPQPGKSEPLLAKALADGYREKVFLATKLPLWSVESRADMDRLLDEQLGRLGAKHIDVYLAHNFHRQNWDRMKALGIRSFFDEARKDGRIRHAAFSFHDQYPLFKEIVEAHDWEAVQIQYNYLDVDYQAGKRGLDLAADRGVGVVVMEPLRGGFLAQHIPESIRAEFKRRRPEWSMADWALRWLWDQPAVGTVLSGMSAMEQVDENLAIAATAVAGALRPEDREALNGARRFFEERTKVACTGCDYCQPCPHNVAISKVFSIYNEYGMADVDSLRARAKMFYNNTLADEERADKCVGCGACEDRCPQHLPIASIMPEVAAVFAEKED